MSIYHNGNSEV